jgi:hypothetical protein
MILKTNVPLERPALSLLIAGSPRFGNQFFKIRFLDEERFENPGSLFDQPLLVDLRKIRIRRNPPPLLGQTQRSDLGNLAIRLAKAVNNHSIPLLARLSVEASLPWGAAVADALRRR